MPFNGECIRGDKNHSFSFLFVWQWWQSSPVRCNKGKQKIFKAILRKKLDVWVVVSPPATCEGSSSSISSNLPLNEEINMKKKNVDAAEDPSVAFVLRIEAGGVLPTTIGFGTHFSGQVYIVQNAFSHFFDDLIYLCSGDGDGGGQYARCKEWDTTRLEILTHVAEALKHLASHESIHGDVAPENVYINLGNKGEVSGRAKLGGFYSAINPMVMGQKRRELTKCRKSLSDRRRYYWAIDTLAAEAAAAAAAAKPRRLAFMAPELFTGPDEDPTYMNLSPLNDIYSFGMLMLEAWIGTPIRKRLGDGDFNRLAQTHKKVAPEGYFKLMLSCLSKDWCSRPTATSIIKSLEEMRMA